MAKLYKLGIACGTPGDATNFYRAMGPLGSLRGIVNSFDIVQMKEVHWAFLKQVDGIFMHRPFTKENLNLCKMIKANRKPLWIDHDDNLFEVGMDNPTFENYSGTNTKELIADIIGMADVVTVSTKFLQTIYGRFNKNVVVIPNAIDDDLLDLDAVPNPTKKLVFWRGSNTHAKDWASVVTGLCEAAKKNDGWQYAFMGYQPWHVVEPLSKVVPPNSIASIGGSDIMRYFGIIRQLSPAIVLVPLFRGPFNYAKSNIAFLEGCYAGAVVVAPDWEGWQVPGVIHYTEGAFGEALDEVLKYSDEKRKEIRSKGWQYIKSNLLLSKVNYLRKGILEKNLGL